MHDRRSRPLHAEIDEGRFASFSFFFLSVFTSTLFLVCLDATRKESCPERSRLVWFSNTPAQVQLLVDRPRQGHGWVVVNFGAVVLVWRPIESQSLDLLAHQRQTKRMYSPPAQPVAWFSISCAKLAAQKFCAGQKKCHARIYKQVETDLTIQFAWRRWLRQRLPSANPLEHEWAPADFAETWYLD